LESESEYNNPKHWTAIYVLPIQAFEFFLIDCRTGPHDEREAPFLCLSSFCILHSSELDFISTFFIRNGLDFANTLAHFSFEMALTLLAHCSFQNGLYLTDFSCLFQGQEAQGCTRRTPLGSI
jgi:hypothetical protein